MSLDLSEVTARRGRGRASRMEQRRRCHVCTITPTCSFISGFPHFQSNNTANSRSQRKCSLHKENLDHINILTYTIVPFIIEFRELRRQLISNSVGFGSLGVTCSPRYPRFAGSNPAEVNGFFQDVKTIEHKSSGRNFKLGVPRLKFQTR